MIRAPAPPRRALALLLAALLLGGAASAISYTVQVVAVSDQEVALSLQRRLLLDGFPAYVVRTGTGQGDVYRVRVGSFANRDAAQVYAEAMPETGGSRPVPALAESIPAGVMPFEARLVGRSDAAGERTEVIPWGEGAALRRRPAEGTGPWRYALVVGGEPGEPVAFDAWRAAPTGDGGAVRVRDLPLWPDTWRDDPAEVRDAYREQRIALVATALGLEPAAVAAAATAREDAAPVLTVVERFDPADGTGGPLLAVGAPVGPDGPEAFLGASAEEVAALLPSPLPLVAFGAGGAPPAPNDAVGDEGAPWRALADGAFARIEIADLGRSWRAAVGAPLWSDGRYLLTDAGGALLFYDFPMR